MHRFNEEGTQIISFDLISPRYDLAINGIANCRNREPLGIDFICQIEEEYCIGDNQQYRHKGDGINCKYPRCKKFLKSIDVGTFYNIMSNTHKCRVLHSILTTLNPDIHCPHIGPTGGGACVDKPLEDWYQNYY